MRSRLLILILLVAIGSVPAMAQENANSMSLDEAINYAWSNSTPIRQKQIDVVDAQKQILENQAYGIPQLNGRLDYTRYVIVPEQPFPELFRQGFEALLPDVEIPRTAAFLLKNNFTAGLDLDAMVFDAKFFAGLRAAKQFKTVVNQELQSEFRNVKSGVVNAYVPVLLINQSIELIDSNMSVIQKLLFETEQLYQSGFAEQLDVDRQRLALSNLNAQKINLEGQKITALKRLKYTMGYPVEQPLVVEENLQNLLEFASPEALSGPIDLTRRPDFILTQEAIKINEMRIKLEQAAFYPSIRAFASAQQAYQGNTTADDFWAPAVLIGGSMQIPIFSGLERKAKVERARLSLNEVELQQQDLIRAIRLEIAAARNNYNTAFETFETQQENLALADRIFNTTKIKYSEGVGSSVEVVQAEQSFYDAQRNYLQAMQDLVLAKQNLDIALGDPR